MELFFRGRWLGLLAGSLLFAASGCGGGPADTTAESQTASTTGGSTAPVVSQTPAQPTATTSETSGDASTGGKETAAQKTPKNPVVVLETSMGIIKIQLDGEKAPLSTANFLEYVNAGHYNGTIFHRVIPTFMIQGGGFTKDMKEKPTRDPIKNEGGNGLKNTRGTVAMARTSIPDSASSQFFINVKDNAFLDRESSQDGVGYAVFGKVTEGMDVVEKIKGVRTETVGPHENVPATPVLIKSAKVAK